MKIALVLDVWDERRGGLETYANAMMHALLAAQHEVRLVTAMVADGLPGGVTVHRVGTPGVAFYEAADAQCAALRQDGFETLWFRHPQTGSVFLPLGGLLESSLAARRRAESAWIRWPKAIARRASAKTRRFLARERAFFGSSTSLVLANSPLVRDEILHRHPGYRGRIDVVGLPVDTAHYRSPRREQRHAARAATSGVDEGDVILLFVGHDFRRKGLGAARAVLRRLRQRKIAAKLLVVGRGASRLGGREPGLVGIDQVEDVLDLYHAADVLVAPSLEDNLSLCVLEALATGLPVVTTASNGAAAWITDRSIGRVVTDPLDVSALDAATLACLDRGLLEDALRARRRAAVADCAIGVHFERVFEVLEQHVSSTVHAGRTSD